MKTKTIELNRVREVLAYDKNTGVFTWNEKPKQWRKGKSNIAGSLNTNGYLRIKVDGARYGAHRLAWFYVYGEWPKNDIDHIDGCRTNNAISNLRNVSRTVNMQNIRTAYSTNNVGVLGVSKKCNKWKAQIRLEGKNKHLGWFDAPELAHQAYLNAKRVHHEGCCI